MSALTGGTLLASLVSLMLDIFMEKTDIIAWGWRLPFILSIGLVIVAIYIRNSVQETSFFCNMRERKATSRVPLVDLITNYKSLILYGFVITCCSAIGITTIYTFLHQLIRYNETFTERNVLYLTTTGSVILCLAMPLFGYLSDKYGRKITFTFGLLGTMVLWGLFVAAVHTNNFTLLSLGMLSISFVFAGINANYCVILTEMFPTNIRYSGVALCYTLGYSICGGLIPLLYLHFINFSQLLILPWICFGVLALISLIIIPKLNTLHQQNLSE